MNIIVNAVELKVKRRWVVACLKFFYLQIVSAPGFDLARLQTRTVKLVMVQTEVEEVFCNALDVSVVYVVVHCFYITDSAYPLLICKLKYLLLNEKWGY